MRVSKRRRRLAAAVLAVVVNMAGTALNASDTWVADDDDDSPEEGAELVDVRQPSEAVARRRGVLRATAAVACGEPIDAAWAVTCAGGRAAAAAAAAVAVQDHPSQYVSVVDLDVERGCPLWPAIFLKALGHCHERHALKAVVRAEGVSLDRVRMVAESAGFVHARSRRIDGEDVAEFYADIYRRVEVPRV
jgi:hypothetical protein